MFKLSGRKVLLQFSLSLMRPFEYERTRVTLRGPLSQTVPRRRFRLLSLYSYNKNIK